MTRAMTAAMKTEFAKGSFRQAHLLDLMFSTPIYITDHVIDTAWNSNTYTAGGHLIDFNPPAEASEVRMARTKLHLSGVDQAYTALFLTNAYIDVRVLFRLALFDSSNAIIADPALLWEGRIEGWDLDETDKISRLSVDIASHWSDFEKVNGRRTNTASQDRHFTGDLGFESAGETVRDLLWGRK